MEERKKIKMANKKKKKLKLIVFRQIVFTSFAFLIFIFFNQNRKKK